MKNFLSRIGTALGLCAWGVGFPAIAHADLNGVMLQYFHWNLPDDGLHWNQLADESEGLFQAGFSAVWLPPATKGAYGPSDVGYAPYDHYDLGEFNQRGSVRTKYGTKKQYLRAIKAAHRAGLYVISDVVMNHVGGADAIERGRAVRVDPKNRNHVLGEEIEIEAWTKFLFKERAGRYSKFQWNWEHFSGVDFAKNRDERGSIYRLSRSGHTGWGWEVDRENGNYDYLMFNDVDFQNPEVRKHLLQWGDWYIRETQVDGFRIDAVKHMQFEFVRDWVRWVQGAKRNVFAVAEYWHSDLSVLKNYVQKTEGVVSLFDFGLHDRLKSAAAARGAYDLGSLFHGTFTEFDPTRSVTFVENHDTYRFAPKRTRQAESWFKPSAYALILLRRDGFPCVFDLDYRGGHGTAIRKLLKARLRYAHGKQIDYFDDRDVVGWTRAGNRAHPKALAVVVTDSFSLPKNARKRMFVGRKSGAANIRRFRELMGNHSVAVEVGADGWGEFPVRSASEERPESGLSVWAEI